MDQDHVSSIRRRQIRVAWMKKNIRKIGLAMGLLFLAVGGPVATWGGVDLARGKASKSWPSVQGRVTQSKEEISTDGSRAVVVYDYRIGDKQYSCGRVSFGQYGYSRDQCAGSIVDRYPKGGTVRVYYKPDEPDVAVLEPGVSDGVFLLIGVGSMIGLFGGFLAIGITVTWFRRSRAPVCDPSNQQVL